MPKVSVILTSFNHEKYLREAIDSVLNQTFTDFELIIWDDASSDNSWDVINKYTDPRIKSFRNDKNRRTVYGINKAISEVATGKYIAVHHSDDVWELDKLEKQVAYLDAHSEIGAVFTNALAITEDGSPLTDETHVYFKIFDQPNRTRYEWLNHFFYKGNALCHPSVLIRKSCYADCGFYRFCFAQIADLDLWIRLCLKYEIHILPEKLVKFRVRDNETNASSNRTETRIRGIYEFYKALEHYKKIKKYDDLVKVFPSAAKFDRNKETDMDFALAMVALEQKPFTFTQLFGMDLLFEVISDPVRTAKIKRLYDFDYKSFIELTAKHDLFSREEVSSLYLALAERDGQITKLTQALVECDARIVNFTQALNEREGQIAGLNQALAERDARIVNLNQAVNEREGQIAGLNQALAERDTRIAGLNQALNVIMASRSWKLTAPLRRLSAVVHRTVASLFLRIIAGYRALPIAPIKKLKNLVFQTFGFAFVRWESYRHWKASQQLVITRHQQPCIAEVGSDIAGVKFFTIDHKKVKNVLIIKFDHIGDIILSLPAIKMLRNKYPQARITMLAGKWAQPLIETTGDIDDFIVCNYYNERSEKSKTKFDRETIKKIKAVLRSGGFDMAIDLRRDVGNGEVFGWFDAKYKIAYYTDENKNLITHGLHLSAGASNVPGAVFKPHITSQLCALIEAIPDENGRYKKNMPIPVPSIVLEDDERFLQKYAKHLSADFLVGFHPGTGSTLRQWPENYFAALADLLIEHLNATIVFFGSQAEKSLTMRIASRVKNENKVFTLVGELSIKEFMLMVKQMKLFVGNVSGPSHIASVLGVPTLVVFAGQVTPYEWHPLGYKTICARVSVPCAPCYLAIPEQCPYNLKCLKLLYPKKVYEATKELLAESGLRAVQDGAALK